ncbi:MAG TPA: response regulator transcription factor [Burkholderiales bacterium]|nr:response regulator transcription factor [Burkholderiales bacterium]
MSGAVTIMVVEDHPATLAALLALLEAAFPGCRLVPVGGAEQALHLCAAAAPHVVVMDIALPGMSGIEATRRIKAAWPETRVVMHSSYEMRVYREGAAAAGASAFVSKSKVASELVPAVASLLAAAP